MILYNANRFTLSGQSVSPDIRWRQIQGIKADVYNRLANKRKEKDKINRILKNMQRKNPGMIDDMLSEPKSRKALEKYVKYVMIEKK